MLMAAATRRASCRSSSVQHRPNELCPSVWSYNCIDRPMTSWPCSASSAAATDESTPPDIATTMRMVNSTTKKNHKDHEDHKDDRGFRCFDAFVIFVVPKRPLPFYSGPAVSQR